MDTAPLSPRNQAAFGTLPGGATLMRASFSDHAFERHSHDCFALGATTHGIQRFRCKGRQYDSMAGDFVLFNPDDDHDGRPGTAEGFRYTIWYVPDDFVASSVGMDQAAAQSRYFSRPHVTDRQMAATFVKLSASLLEAPGESLRVESLVRTLLETMLRRHGERPLVPRPSPHAGDAVIARVKDYIRTFYADDLTVSDLAAAAGLSRAHLTRVFGAACHMPPHVYLNAVRVAQAQARIRSGMPLAAVALECGFADQSHLTRRFKGSVGVTPSAWRQMQGILAPHHADSGSLSSSLSSVTG